MDSSNHIRSSSNNVDLTIDGEACTICLEILQFYNSNEVLITPACCGKFFHYKCIKHHIGSSSECPHCRATIHIPNILTLKSNSKSWFNLFHKKQQVPVLINRKLSLNEIICHEVCVVCHTQVKHRAGDQCIISLGCCGKFYHETCLNTTIEITKKSKCVNCHERFKVSTATHTSSTTSNNNSFRLWNRNTNNTTNNAMNNNLTSHVQLVQGTNTTTNNNNSSAPAVFQIQCQHVAESVARAFIEGLVAVFTPLVKALFMVIVIFAILCFISFVLTLYFIWKRQYLYAGIIVLTGIIFVSGIYSIIQKDKLDKRRQ